MQETPGKTAELSVVKHQGKEGETPGQGPVTDTRRIGVGKLANAVERTSRQCQLNILDVGKAN